MEDKIAFIRGALKEIESSIIILRDAVSNDNNDITFEKVEDMLDILLNKMANDRIILDEFIDEFSTRYLKNEVIT